MNIETILSQIELGNYALPEFQRGYVWNRDQVRKLMNSLYRGYPIGGLLTWVTPVDTSIMRNGGTGQNSGKRRLNPVLSRGSQGDPFIGLQS